MYDNLTTDLLKNNFMFGRAHDMGPALTEGFTQNELLNVVCALMSPECVVNFANSHPGFKGNDGLMALAVINEDEGSPKWLKYQKYIDIFDGNPFSAAIPVGQYLEEYIQNAPNGTATDAKILLAALKALSENFEDANRLLKESLLENINGSNVEKYETFWMQLAFATNFEVWLKNNFGLYLVGPSNFADKTRDGKPLEKTSPVEVNEKINVRQNPDEKTIYQNDFVSGKSAVAQTIFSDVMRVDGSIMSRIICSNTLSPQQIISKVSQINSVVLNDAGQIGTTISGQSYSIGEYKFIQSKAHSFNAVVICLLGSDRYNLNNTNDCTIFNSSCLIADSILKLNDENIVSSKIAASNQYGVMAMTFDIPIAQQVYDSTFVDKNASVLSGAGEGTPSWFVSSKAQKNNQKSGGCYVATAVYGSYDCPQVWTLRRYRDYSLASTWFGRLFIKTYYAVSPTIVKWFGKTKWFNMFWKSKLDKMVVRLNGEGFEDTPYND